MALALTRDGRLLFATSAVRACAYGFLSVILGLYLESTGLSAAVIGMIFTAALAGGAVMTILITTVADKIGRRRMLIAGAILMAGAGCVFALTDNVALLMFAAVIGTISPSGKEVGPFLSIEQAMLPQTTTDRQRTAVFSAYNLISSLAGAVGALAVSVPVYFSVSLDAGYRYLIWAYVLTALVLAGLSSCLSRAVEAPVKAIKKNLPLVGLHQSRKMVFRLAALFALDAFAGAFIVQSIVAYWFHLRFQTDLSSLGTIFFGTNLCAALSFLAAPAIARRIGLLNTMVITHLPSNFLILLVPLMPTMEWAVLVLLGRHLLSQMDVPTRQSYTMAIVAADERAAAAGVLSVARNAGAAVAPLFTGAILANPLMGWPFLLAGGLKVIYDLWIFALFRDVKPPEENY